jgi:hypothetical protein
VVLKLMQCRYQYCKQCAIYLIMDQFLFKKHLDPHAAVFHNTKCSLAVPVSVLPIPPMYRRFPLFFPASLPPDPYRRYYFFLQIIPA